MPDAAQTSRIFLLRHAKAGWPAPGGCDFERTLDARGRDEAARIGRIMAAKGYEPERVLCSAAKRCRETWDIVGGDVAAGDIVHTRDLYEAESAAYLDLIRRQNGVRSVIIVGHNPTMEETAARLLNFDDPATDNLDLRFPTAGLAVIDLDGPLSEAGRAPARLDSFLTSDTF